VCDRMRPIVRALVRAGFCGAMARRPHAALLVSLSPPLQHAAVELLRRTMAKHNFIAYRDDRLDDSHPVTFDGDVWRSYVSLHLPWTLCIRDRVPPVPRPF
jgi:hypothetical protein